MRSFTAAVVACTLLLLLPRISVEKRGGRERRRDATASFAHSNVWGRERRGGWWWCVPEEISRMPLSSLPPLLGFLSWEKGGGRNLEMFFVTLSGGGRRGNEQRERERHGRAGRRLRCLGKRRRNKGDERCLVVAVSPTEKQHPFSLPL